MNDRVPGEDVTAMEQRGFGRRVGFGQSPALLVVDFQQGFTNPETELGAVVDDEIAAANRLIDAAREASLPVLFTRICYSEPDVADAGVWRDKIRGLAILKLGEAAVEQDPRLHRQPGDPVVSKRYASAFYGTDLHSRLQVRRVDTVVVAGCSTSGCVRATVVDACQAGLRAIVAREAVADRSPIAHEQSLVDIEMKYGDVLSINSIIDHFNTLRQRRT